VKLPLYPNGQFATARDAAKHAIDTEREYQKKWGEKPHEVAAFILYMEHHLEKARALASSMSPETPALEEIRKVTALGVACMEQHGAPPRVLR
jgi:hypothetical protein